MPKTGPFKALAFNNPTAQTEDLYFKSINTTFDQYRAFLKEVSTDSLLLPNRDFDTGKETKAAEYSLTDDTYAKLLVRLSKRKFDLTTTALRDNILQFYSDLSAAIETKKDNGSLAKRTDCAGSVEVGYSGSGSRGSPAEVTWTAFTVPCWIAPPAPHFGHPRIVTARDSRF